MNYRRPELLDALAAEFVLGTLRGSARRRFHRLMAELPEARSAVERWEQDLAPLSEGLNPVTPNPSTWNRLEARLFSNDGEASTPSRAVAPGLWRPYALAATILCAVLALTLLRGVESEGVESRVTHAAQIADEGALLWVVSADLQSGRLKARALSVAAAELDRVFELWMLPQAGDPQSLGLLPVGTATTERELPPALAALLQTAAGIAVSIEPAGGSPVGVPTGPVVHQAVLSEL